MGGFLQRAPCSRVRHHLVGAAARRLCWLATAWSCCGRCRGSPPWWSCRRGAVFCVSGGGRRMTCRGWWRRAVNKGGGGGWWWLGYGQWWLLCDKTTTPHPTKSDDRQNLVSNKPRQIAIFRCCAFVTVSRKRPSSVIMRQVGSNQTWHGFVLAALLSAVAQYGTKGMLSHDMPRFVDWFVTTGATRYIVAAHLLHTGTCGH